jgi:hypothetical protein
MRRGPLNLSGFWTGTKNLTKENPLNLSGPSLFPIPSCTLSLKNRPGCTPISMQAPHVGEVTNILRSCDSIRANRWTGKARVSPRRGRQTTKGDRLSHASSHDALAAIHPQGIASEPVSCRVTQRCNRAGYVLGQSQAMVRISLARDFHQLFEVGDLA